MRIVSQLRDQVSQLRDQMQEAKLPLLSSNSITYGAQESPKSSLGCDAQKAKLTSIIPVDLASLIAGFADITTLLHLRQTSAFFYDAVFQSLKIPYKENRELVELSLPLSACFFIQHLSKQCLWPSQEFKTNCGIIPAAPDGTALKSITIENANAFDPIQIAKLLKTDAAYTEYLAALIGALTLLKEAAVKYKQVKGSAIKKRALLILLNAMMIAINIVTLFYTAPECFLIMTAINLFAFTIMFLCGIYEVILNPPSENSYKNTEGNRKTLNTVALGNIISFFSTAGRTPDSVAITVPVRP